MSQILRFRLFWILLVFVFGVFGSQVYAQTGCGGFNGAPQPSGGITSDEPGSLCLNDASQIPGTIDIIASNVADGSNPYNFSVVINWDDGSPLQTISYGGAIPISYTAATHRYEIQDVPHTFLPKLCNASPGRQCAYKPQVYLRIAGTTCPSDFGNPPDFFRYNTDDQCSGAMALLSGGSAIYEVCAGASTDVTFQDNTRLNCLPPQELTGLNDAKRWRRFTYGLTTTITEGGASDQILIDGVAQNFPFQPSAGVPVQSGDDLTNSAPPFANNNTAVITIPSTATVGQEFHIRMEYWNVCNQYDDGTGVPPINGDRPSVFRDAIIRVVDKPGAPTPHHREVCNGETALPNFRIDPPLGVTTDRIFWYQDAGGVPGTSITNTNGNNNQFLPPSAYPGGINRFTAGVYTVWAKYRSLVNANGLYCESDLVRATLTIRQPIATPGPITGNTSICNTATAEPFSVPIPAAALTPPGGPPGGGPDQTEYIWDVLDGSNNPVGDVTITPSSGTNAAAQNVTANFTGTSIPGLSVTRKIRVRRQYTTNSTHGTISRCTSNEAVITITVYKNTTGGSLTGGDTQCQGQNLNQITWNAGVGNIARWEMSTNGGPYVTVPSFGTSNPVNPTTLGLTTGGAPTTYSFRARIENGVCNPQYQTAVDYVINPNALPANAGPDQLALCFPTPPLQTMLAGNTNGTILTQNWTVVTKPAASIVSFADATDENTMVTVDRPGTYIFRWTIDNGTCQSQDDVTIIFGQDPAMPVPTPASFCSLNGTLNAVANTFEDVKWTLVGGPGTATITDDTQISTSVSVSVFGSYTFNLEFSSGGCATKDQNVVIDFNEPATVDPLTDELVCGEDFTIDGNIGGGASQGQWEIVTGTGTFSSSGAATGSVDASLPNIADTYQPSVGDLASGFVILRLRALDPDGGQACADVTRNVRIDFDLKPAPAAVAADFSVCGTSTSLNAVTPTNGGVGTWSNITAGPDIVNPSITNSTVNDLILGANQFLWTVNSAQGTCAPTNATLTITRVTPPGAVSLTPNDLCEEFPNTGIDQSVDLTTYNNTITGGAAGVAVDWFTNAARTIAVADVTDEDVADGATYYIAVRTTGPPPVCSTNGTVTFTINPAPFVANLSPAACEDPLTPGEIQNVNLESYNDDVSLNLWPATRNVSWFSDAALTIPIATPTDIDNITDGATYYARVENTTTGCYNRADVVFDINTIPAVPTIDGPDKVCYDPNEIYFYKVNTILANHTYQWNVPAPPTGAQSPTGIYDDFFLLLQFPDVVTGGVDITVTDTSPEGCSATSLPLNIVIEDNPSTLTITGPNAVCESETGIVFTTQVYPVNYAWNVPPGASIIAGQGTDQVTVNFGTSAGDVTVTPSTAAGCPGTPAVKPVAINLRPVLADLDDEICSQQQASLTLVHSPGEAATSFNIQTRVSDAGLFQTNGVVVPDVPPGPTGVASNYLFDQAFENKTGGPLNVRYTVIPVSAANCVGSSKVITLKINPEPQLDPDIEGNVCSEFPTGVTLRPAVGSYPAASYIIQSFNANGLTSATPLPVTGIELDQMAIFNDKWINNGTTFVTVEYSIVPKSAEGCLGNPASIVPVRIFPKPQIITAPSEICSDDPSGTGISLNSNITGASISWTIPITPNNVTGASAGTQATLPSFIPNVLTNSSSTLASYVEYQLVATNPTSLNSCASDPQLVRVDVNPAPSVPNPPILTHACSDNPAGPLEFTGPIALLEPLINNTGSVTMQWFEDAAMTIPIVGTHTFQNGVSVHILVTKNDATACTKSTTLSYNITPQVTLAPPVIKDLDCFGQFNGEVTVNVLTGTPGDYSYSIGGGPFISPSPNTSTYTFTGLTGDNTVPYTIRVKDVKDCEGTITALVQVPPQLTAALSVEQDITCYSYQDGAIRVTPSGGTPPYKDHLLLQASSYDIDKDNIFPSLGRGIYNVRVEDDNGCKVDAEINLTEPTLVEITNVNVPVNAFGYAISCTGQTDASIEVSVTGGNTVPTPYNYKVTKGTDIINVTDGIIHTFNTSTGNPIGPGSYKIEVTDVKGCPALPRFVNISDVPVFNGGRVGIDQAVCEGEDPASLIEISPAFGGVGAYQYTWQQSLLGENDWVNVGVSTATYDPPVLPVGVRYFRRVVTSGSCAEKGKEPFERVKVTVNPLPEVNFEGPGILCPEIPLMLTIDLITGTAPIEYDYSYNGLTFLLERGADPASVFPPTQLTAPTTYTLQRLKDANGCEIFPNLTQTVNPFTANDANLQIIGPTEQCPGLPFSLQWNAEADITYTLNWADGTTETFSGIDGTVTPDPHIFPEGAAGEKTVYPVTLLAKNNFCPQPSTATIPLTVYPGIALNVSPADPVNCSGTPISFQDQSVGVDFGSWFYREVGTTDRLGEKPAPISTVDYVVTNPSTIDPIVYEFIYEAKNNEGCNKEFKQEIKVYNGVKADFSISDVLPIVGGSSNVTYTNTSSIIDDNIFEYTWDFDDVKASPATANGIGPYTVEYYTSGIRFITLRAYNIQAEADGESCASKVTKTINIEQPEFSVSFTATPLASCFPTNITVQNTSGAADTFIWEVYSAEGLVTSSNLANPVFRILKPGIYDIYLTASLSTTNQVALAELKGIEVFDVPSANFEARPNTLYIPDTELRVFNFSNRANLYIWDFGDGFISNEFEPSHAYPLEGKYEVTLIAGFDNGNKDINGDGILDGNVVCYDSAKQEVLAIDGGFLKLPNAFTPNIGGSTGGNGRPGSGSFNDVFLPITKGVEEFTMHIFDRWGTLVFESKSKDIGWDGYDRNGKLMPAGVYVYKLVMRLSDGQRTTKVGDVTLIR